MNGNLYLIELGIWQYASIRRDYWDAIEASINEYLTDNKKTIASLRNSVSSAINLGFQAAALQAWRDGLGVKEGEEAVLSNEAFEWLSGKQTEEIGFAHAMSEQMRILKSDGIGKIEAFAEARKRAEGYSKTLDSIYANIKLMANPKKMLTFDGDDGEESCSDCSKYKGKRHSASWWISMDAVPPSRSFECKGYKCNHYLRDDNNRIYTL